MEKVRSVEVEINITGKLRKDLLENEELCPICNGTGIVIDDNEYGLGEDGQVRFPYKKQTVVSCRNCVNGVVKKCSYCGETLQRYTTTCYCEKSLEVQRKEKEEQEIKGTLLRYENATKITIDEAREKFDILFVEEKEEYIDSDDCDLIKEYLEKYHIFGTEKTDLQIDAQEIVENACEELHEDSFDNVDNINELQKAIDDWAEKNAKGAGTYWPDYKYAISKV